MADLASVKVFVHGRVKGIGFRAFVSERAEALELNGYARNLPNERTVEVEAEGKKAGLEKLVDFLRVGPPLARVEGMEVEWAEYTGKYSEFTIRR